MKKYFLIGLFLTAAGLLAQTASAQIIPGECSVGTAEKCNLCSFVKLVINLADIIIALSGSAAILMFVIGGIMMIINYGNEAWIKRGRETIVATVIGLAIVFLAWTLVNLVILTLYGGNLGAFIKFTGKSAWSGPCASSPATNNYEAGSGPSTPTDAPPSNDTPSDACDQCDSNYVNMLAVCNDPNQTEDINQDQCLRDAYDSQQICFSANCAGN